MGIRNKLLTSWHGKTPLESVCSAAINSNCDKTIVVTGHQQPQIMEAISEFDLLITHNPEFKSGMASSIKQGVLEAQQIKSDAILVLLGDMPGVTAIVINKMIATALEASQDAIIIATCAGKRGNPVLWPKSYFDELTALEGDKGARQIFSKYEDKTVELELGEGVLFDLDTPESFQLKI